jgi:hypothetical protein
MEKIMLIVFTIVLLSTLPASAGQKYQNYNADDYYHQQIIYQQQQIIDYQDRQIAIERAQARYEYKVVQQLAAAQKRGDRKEVRRCARYLRSRGYDVGELDR